MMISVGRSQSNGRKKKMAIFSALRRAGAVLLISMIALEKAVQFYVCPPECCSSEYTWNRPGTDKDHGKQSLDVVDPTEIGQGCVINYAEMDNCFSPQDNQDAHQIIKMERKIVPDAETGDAQTEAFIRFVKKNHQEVVEELAKAMIESENIKEDGHTLHTECGDFKKVFVSGRWTYVAQT